MDSLKFINKVEWNQFNHYKGGARVIDIFPSTTWQIILLIIRSSAALAYSIMTYWNQRYFEYFSKLHRTQQIN